MLNGKVLGFGAFDVEGVADVGVDPPEDAVLNEVEDDEDTFFALFEVLLKDILDNKSLINFNGEFERVAVSVVLSEEKFIFSALRFSNCSLVI